MRRGKSERVLRLQRAELVSACYVLAESSADQGVD